MKTNTPEQLQEVRTYLRQIRSKVKTHKVFNYGIQEKPSMKPKYIPVDNAMLFEAVASRQMSAKVKPDPAYVADLTNFYD